MSVSLVLEKVSYRMTFEACDEVQDVDSGREMDENAIWDLTRSEFISLGCPFEEKINIHVDVAQKATTDWAKKFHIPSSEKYKFARLMGGAHPHCSAEMLTLFTCWVTMLFYYDDRVETVLCKNPEALKEFNEKNLRVLRGEIDAEENDDVLTRAICDLRKGFEKISTPAWRARFAKDVQEHLDAVVWESLKEGAADFETYLEKRPYTSAVYLMFDLCELAEGVSISKEVFESDYFKEIRLLGNNWVWGPNDLVSYPKESKKAGNNLILIFKKQNLGEMEAIKKTKEFCREELKKIESLLEKMPAGYTENEKRYIRGILFWLRSNYDWSLETERYKKPSLLGSLKV